MFRLNDTQLVILAAAADRKDGRIMPVPKSLKATKDALIAVLKTLLKRGLISERVAAREEEHWRAEGDERFALIITEDGMKAISGEQEEAKPAGRAVGKNEAKARRKRVIQKHSKRAETKNKTGAKGTKQALLIGLLERKTGATIKEVIKVTGWQAHSVRGAISGTLKKKLGLTVNSQAVDGRGRVYRVTAGR